MHKTSASACAKAILLGEHAVVYGQGALAMPLPGLRLMASVEEAPQEGFWVSAPCLGLGAEGVAETVADGHFLKDILALLQTQFSLKSLPDSLFHIESSIPLGAGLGGSAALAVAVLRAYSAFLDLPISTQELNALAYESEKGVHGRPSGIDNTVISYEKAIYFKQKDDFAPLEIKGEFFFLLADSGLPKATVQSVAQLARLRETEPVRVQASFEAIGRLVLEGRESLQAGDAPRLGLAMLANQEALQSLGVSCAQLDALVGAAQAGGALGAKLTGGGLGGHVLVLCERQDAPGLQARLIQAGAQRVFSHRLGAE